MKHLLYFLLLISAPAFAQKKAVQAAPAPRFELRGIVTYFFNDNLGNKPDVGAKAFIISQKAAKAEGINMAPLKEYLANHDAREYDPSRSTPALLPGEEDIEPIAMKAQQAIIKSASTAEATADGSGVFVKRLRPGTYWVMIRSANRTRINLLESIGQVVIKQVVIGDDDAEVATNFGI